jgi:hypothetical protein
MDETAMERQWVRQEMAEWGIPPEKFDLVWFLYQILGPNEGHDGFQTTLEELVQMLD